MEKAHQEFKSFLRQVMKIAVQHKGKHLLSNEHHPF